MRSASAALIFAIAATLLKSATCMPMLALYPWRASYDNKSPESPEFGCKEAEIDPESLCDPNRVHMGTQGKINSHIDNAECIDHSQHRVIKSIFPKTFQKITFLREIDGLKKARQFLECQYTYRTKKKNDKEVQVKQYYIFMKKIQGLSVPNTMNEDGFKPLKSDKKVESDEAWALLYQSVRSKLVWYAQRYGIGHKDPNSTNIRVQGKDISNYKIDFVDWAQWDAIPDAAALAAYEAFVDGYLPTILKKQNIEMLPTSSLTTPTTSPPKTPSPGGSPRKS